MTAYLWPGPLNSTETAGKLTINGVDMHTLAWNVLDIIPLWIHSATRGENVIIPGADGRRAYPRRIDEGRYSLPMLIGGVADKDGNAYTNRWSGLQANLEYLRANVVTPPAAPTATRSATLLMPDGTTRIAEVQVDILVLPPHDSAGRPAASLECILELIVPPGRFVAAPVASLEPSDNFDDATELDIASDAPSVSGSNVGATAEVDEPDHCFGDPVNSVWWKFTAPSNGTLDVNTDGSDFDTILEVYSGGPLINDLFSEGCNDDGDNPPQSTLTGISILSGQPYWIMVQGFDTDEGNIVLNWAWTPA